METKETTVPLDRESVRRIIDKHQFNLRSASIREMNKLVNAVELETGCRFIRMEFGVPGLPVNPIAIEAETAALAERGVGHVYAPFEGVPPLKEESTAKASFAPAGPANRPSSGRSSSRLPQRARVP